MISLCGCFANLRPEYQADLATCKYHAYCAKVASSYMRAYICPQVSASIAAIVLTTRNELTTNTPAEDTQGMRINSDKLGSCGSS